MLIGLVALPLIMKIIIFKNRKNLGDEVYKSRFGTLTEGLRIEDYHPLGIYWNVFKTDRFMIVGFILFLLPQ